MEANSFLSSALLVGAGGFVGSVLRFGLGGLVQRAFGFPGFPFGTLTVNVLGCLLIGAFAGFVESRQLVATQLRTFALIGVLGGFTTFSTFGFDTFSMIREGEALRAGANVLVSVALGLLCVWLGYSVMNPR